MALTVKKVKSLISKGTPGKHTDGAKGGGVKGLMLCIEGKTSAHWLLRYQLNHKTRHMGLGSFFDLSLADARERARRERVRLADRVDPLALRDEERKARRQAEAKRLTFKQAAERYHAAKAAEWSSDHHAAEFISSLQRYVYPHIGNFDIAAVGKTDVLRVLNQKMPPDRMGKDAGTFWTARQPTGDRTRNRIKLVLDWAEAAGYRPEGTPNPARWKGFLDHLLAKPRKIAPIKNMAAMPYVEVPALMAVLAADPSVGAQAVRFIVLTTCRVSEALKGTWAEADLEAAEWMVPASRMKARREHRVPLAPQAMELLRSLYREDGNAFLFIGKQPGTHVSETTVTESLRRAGRTETLHGMRSAFSTWAAERTSFPREVVEAALAHAIESQVEAAYKRTTFFEKRRKLMEAWGKYCCTPVPVDKQTGKIVPLRA
jgi:integrase